MEPAGKKRKLAPKRHISSPAVADKNVSHTQIASVDFKVQQGKKFAVTQAQQEGCLGNFRSFDSAYGNFLVPVIPNRADLFGFVPVHESVFARADLSSEMILKGSRRYITEE